LVPHPQIISPLEDLLMALTGKKRAFADAVLAGFSNKEAAKKAGYSAATASAAGSRLVKDKAVAAHIALARAAAPRTEEKPVETVPAESMTPSFDINAALMHTDAKMFLTVAMNDTALDAKLRIDAAKALLPFTHKKLGEGGKKEEKQEAAEKASTGKFGLRAVK
jgi:phage terminase small subunit